jgi:hypothetical protein
MKFSIIQNKKECYVCKTTYGLEFHHCIFGTGRRKLADEDGLTVWLCSEHHRGTFGVHGKCGNNLNIKLKEVAIKRWCEFYNKTIDQYIARYGWNKTDFSRGKI